jgi:hypothetical protein
VSQLPSTYTLISSNVLSSSAASVTFSAIPSTYTDLILKASTRANAGSGNITWVVSINGSPAGSDYSMTELIGEGSSAFSLRQSNFYWLQGYALENDTGTTSNTFNNVEMYLPNYTLSANKPLSIYGVKENNSSTVNVIDVVAGLWRNSAAVTSIRITNSNSSIASGSSFYLYGIKNS